MPGTLSASDTATWLTGVSSLPGEHDQLHGGSLLSKLTTTVTFEVSFEVDLSGFHSVVKLNFLTINSTLNPSTTEIQEQCKLSDRDLWEHPETLSLQMWASLR